MEAIITSGNDGFLYVWDENRISKKQLAHEAPVLSLHTIKDSPMFASGGMDGKVVLWYLGLSEYSYKVEKLHEYSLTMEDISKTILNPKYHIQSVCIGSKYVLAGNKCGDIYELTKPKEPDNKSNYSRNFIILEIVKQNFEMIKLRLNCTDNEPTRVVAFSGNAEKLYSITQKVNKVIS
jgi:WD40 repeat protein